MAKNSGNINLKASIELVDRTSKGISSIEKSMDRLIRGFENITTVVGGLSDLEVGVDTSEAEANIKGLNDEAEAAEAGLTGLGDGVKGVGDKAEKVKETVTGFKDETEELGDTADKTGEQIERAFEEAKNALSVLGYTKGVDIIIDKFKEASEEAMEFEKSLAKLSTIADESIGMSELREEIEVLSDDTNKNVNDLSEAAYQAISASVDTAESIGFVADATKLAEGGFTESATSVDVLTTAINAYKLEASDAARISDMLINTQNLGKTTVDRLAGSMGAVIPIAAAYKVQIDQLSTGYVELTRQGIDTAMSGTYLRGMLQELGDSSSKVAQVLKGETGYAFADLMTKGYSLGDVLQVLGDSVNGNSAAFVELWSNIRASTGALALYNAGAEDFNSVLTSMTECVGATDAAYAKMTNTTAHAKEGMENATSRLADSIGSDLNPALKGLYEIGDKAFTWLADLNKEIPIVTVGLASGATALIAFGGSLTFVGVVIPKVTTSIKALNLVLEENPFIFWLTTIAATTAGIIALASAINDTIDVTEKLTASSEKQKREIEELQKEYDSLKADGKGLSEEASRLRYEIDDLTASFEANKKTVGEVITEGEALKSEYDEIIGSYEETVSGIENETAASYALIQKFEDIASSAGNAATKTAELKSIYDRLSENTTVTGFDSFEKAAADAESYAKSMKTVVKAQNNSKLKAGLIDDEVDYEEQIGKEEAYIKGVELLKADAEKAYNDLYNASEYHGNNLYSGKNGKELKALKDEIDAYNTVISEHQGTIDDYNVELKRTEATLRALEAEQQNEINSVTDLGGAVETAKDVASDALSSLETAYDNAYNAALESIQGQIGLFDKMETKSDLSASQMVENLKSQSEYLTTYTENLRTAASLGLDKGLLSSLSDGSDESAGQLDTIVKGLQNGEITLEEINGQYQNAMDLQAKWAAQVAAQDIDVSAGTEEALRQMYGAIDQMDLSAELEAQAQEQANAYIAGILGVDVSQVSELGAKINSEIESSTADIVEAANTADQKVTETADNMTTTLGAVADETPGLGANAIIGFVNGMESQQAYLESAAAALASTVRSAFTGVLDINSPSKVMEEYGEYTGEGAILGIERKIDEAEKVGRRLGESFSLSYRDSETLKNAEGYVRTEYRGDTIIRIDMSGMKNEVSGDYDVDRMVKDMENRLTEALYNTAAGNHR